jgi:hypothetical protein
MVEPPESPIFLAYLAQTVRKSKTTHAGITREDLLL